MNVSILRAGLDDAEAILGLQKRAYEAEARLYDDWSIPPLTQSVDSLREELGSMHVLKAVQDGAVAGSVRARAEGATCHIGRLIVEPELQGRGIGSALLRAIEAEFPGAMQFELFTGSKSEANIRLYQRHGYEVVTTRALSARVVLVYMGKARAEPDKA